MSEEHDLKNSEQTVGQLLPIIKDARGKIVDGLHRAEVNPNWRTETRSDIKTEEEYWKSRAHLNFSRRNAHAARDEKIEIIGALRKIYEEKGLSDRAVESAIVQALNGAISKTTIREILNPSNKPIYPTKIPAITVLERDKFIVKNRYGEGFVDRLKKEVKEEAKQELLKSPEFIVEAIASSPEITKIVEAPIPQVTMSKEELAKTAENIEQVQKEIEQRKRDPKHIERGELVKNWMAHTRVTGVAESLHCPICGSDSNNLVWKCHSLSISEAHKMIKERLQS